MGMAESITCVSIAVWLLDDFLSHSINICLSSVGILQLTQLRSRCYSVGPPSVPHSPHFHCLLYSWVLSFQLLFISSFCVSFACCFCVSPPPPNTETHTSLNIQQAYQYRVILLYQSCWLYMCKCVQREYVYVCVWERMRWGQCPHSYGILDIPRLWHSAPSPHRLYVCVREIWCVNENVHFVLLIGCRRPAWRNRVISGRLCLHPVAVHEGAISKSTSAVRTMLTCWELQFIHLELARQHCRSNDIPHVEFWNYFS